MDMDKSLVERLLSKGREIRQQPLIGRVGLIREWLALVSEHYRQEVTELSVVAYLTGLNDLLPEEIERGFSESLRRCSFMPTVADVIRNSYQQTDYTSPQGTGCELCGGMGWKTVERDGYRKAVKCGCVKAAEKT